MTFSASYDNSVCQFAGLCSFQVSEFHLIFNMPILETGKVKCSVEGESWEALYQSRRKRVVIFKFTRCTTIRC